MASRISRRKLLVRVGLGLVSGLSAYAFGIEPDWLEVTHTEVPMPGLGKGFDGFRIGVVSDIHYPEWVDAAYIKRAFGLLMDQKPDLVCVPGDIYQAETKIEDHPYTGILDHVHAPHGVFGSLGNHDCRCNRPKLIKAIHDQTPIRMLINESVVLSRGGDSLALGGLPMLRYTPKIDLGLTFGHLPPEMPRIALCHHPDFAMRNGETERVDLLIAGHTHGGQVRLTPWYAPVTMSAYGSKFLGGLVQGDGFRVFVSRGIARPSHVRFLSRPEVSVLTLRCA